MILAHFTGMPHHAEEFNLLGLLSTTAYIAALLAVNWIRAKILRKKNKQIEIIINKN